MERSSFFIVLVMKSGWIVSKPRAERQFGRADIRPHIAMISDSIPGQEQRRLSRTAEYSVTAPTGLSALSKRAVAKSFGGSTRRKITVRKKDSSDEPLRPWLLGMLFC